MTSPDAPRHEHAVSEAMHATAEPISLAENEGEQSTGASATGAAVAAIEEGVG